MKPGETAPLPPRLREDIALLATYLLSSGRGLLQEPSDYGVFRCVDGARRALEIMDQHGASTPELAAIREGLDTIMLTPMGSEQPPAEILDDLCLHMVTALTGMEAAQRKGHDGS
ncbi:DUF6092 family protein [Streptomyces sp. NEAU-S7GS2]|uniref:DUF6092 family protein n=1 Tax=Streptomyces sp. NEAU-S7GS2 TaxID=2202000 RepID=UPI001EF4D593|nr:DUF6092 family protein [Streptomyces sp. NEAU-S7GS2]